MPMIVKAPEVSQKICSFIAEYDQAGLYPGLELFNLLFSESEGRLLPDIERPLFRKRTHDFTRKLVWGFPGEINTENVFIGDETPEILKNLFESLQLEVPNIKSINSWERAHFFPYTKSMIHWDARRPRGKGDVLIERRYLRGAGAYLYKTLRTDQNADRLKKIRQGFEDLYKYSENSSLDKITVLMGNHSFADHEAKADLKEIESSPVNDHEDDLLRDGIAAILAHSSVSSSTRIYAIIRFVAMWLVITQMRRSARSINADIPYIVIDCGNGASQVRRLSSRNYKETLTLIDNAVTSYLQTHDKSLAKAQRQKIKGFFGASCATIGLVNAFKGKRHFQLGLETLEMLVLLETVPDREEPFEQFLDNLYRKWGFVINRESADIVGLTDKTDASMFDKNKAFLAYQLQAAGLVTSYSDATKMITTKDLV